MGPRLEPCGHPLSVAVLIVTVGIYLSVRKSLQRFAMFVGTLASFSLFCIIGNHAELNAFFMSSAMIAECSLSFLLFLIFYITVLMASIVDVPCPSLNPYYLLSNCLRRFNVVC